ncbi:MAG: TetR/AcrR family transcriptional regulator [Lentihominibacter sp.]
MKSRKTREKILDVSLQLFNEKKASNVSTVQISAAMKISPGNLYYYFANKEELIRCMWKERMLDEIEHLAGSIREVRDCEELDRLINECFDHYERFMFFYSETATLFANDSELRELYDARLEASYEDVRAFMDRWISEGRMVDIPDDRKRVLAENIILLMKVQFTGLNSYNENRKSNIFAVIDPYIIR